MRNCPLCGSPSGQATFPYETNWGGRLFTTLRCTACGSAFIDPLPNDADFAEFYRKDAYHDSHYANLEPQSFPTALNQVRPFLKAGGTLLDFGCGNGAFLRTAAEAGFECTGVELDEATRQWAASNSGCPVVPIETLERQAERFDVIHLGDVLEHVPDPAGTLRRLEGLLAPGGAFFIEGPLENNPSPVYWASRTFGALKRRLSPAPANWPPLHLFRATAKAQRAFFERLMGYDVRAFRVWEDGWPYASRETAGRLPASAAEAMRRAIAAGAIGVAAAARPFGLQLGNRFAAVIARR